MSVSQKSATLQSFGWIFTEVTMLLTLLHCIESLQYTLIYVGMIIPAVIPTAVVLALFHRGTAYILTIVLVILAASLELVYGILLVALLPRHQTEIQLATDMFFFYLLLGGLVIHLFLLVWMFVLLFQVANAKPSHRLAIDRTAAQRPRYTAETRALIALIVVYYAVLIASSFLNLVTTLEWTAFYIVLFLPYGIPFLMTMLLFKHTDSVDVGTVMILFVAFVDLIYTGWLVLSYTIQREFMQATDFGILWFWILVSSFVVRIGLSLAYSGILRKIRDVPFERRFDTVKLDKEL